MIVDADKQLNEGEVLEIYKTGNLEIFICSRETLILLANNESLCNNHDACLSKISL